MEQIADQANLDRLVHSHLPAALKFAVRLTGDPDHAEEIVQEALVRVSKGWKSFRGESQFRTWLLRIVINVFRDHFSKRTIQESLSEDFADPKVNAPPTEALANELSQLIADCVSALPTRQREVLVLSSFEGLSPSEVAEVLRISEANVHATLHVARRRLKNDLAPYLANR